MEEVKRAVHRAAAPRPGSALIRAGLTLFAIGVGAIVVTFAGYAFGGGNRPL